MLGIIRKGFDRRTFIFLILLCMTICFLTYGCLNFNGFAYYCNSDVYSDAHVAQLMWEQKTLFPEGWGFGNQFYVVATPVIAALFYGITGSMNLSMVMATEVMTVLVFVSFLWLLRSVTKDLLLQLTACLVIFAANVAPWGPYSVNSMLFFTQASFYSCYMIGMFVVFGDYIRAYQSEERRTGAFVLSMVLSFALGMQSLRQTVVMVLPILACEIFLTIRRSLLHKKAWNPNTLFRSLGYAAANVAGIVTIKWIGPEINPIYGEMELTGTQGIAQRIQPLGTALSEITSLSYVLEGECTRWTGYIILGLILVVAVAAVFWLIRIHKEETPLELCWLLLAVGILGVLMSTVVMTITIRGIYLFMWFPLVACSVLLVMRKLPDLMQKGLIVILCAATLWGMRDSYGVYFEILEQKGDEPAAQVAQWAVERDYEYVYGEYWSTAPSVAVQSDGRLKAGSWHTPEHVFLAEKVNNLQNIYGEAENQKAIYVFTSADEEAGLAETQERGVTMEKMVQFGDYSVYTSPVPLMQVQK